MKKGQTSIKNSLNELSKQGLLEWVGAEFERANHLYIKIPKDVEIVGKLTVIASKKQLSVGHKSTPKKARYSSANNYNKSNNYYTRLITEMDYSFEEGESFDVMTRPIQKYGPGILAEVRKADEAFALPHHKRPRT